MDHALEFLEGQADGVADLEARLAECRPEAEQNGRPGEGVADILSYRISQLDL